MLIIGHRGARGLAPENTIAALQEGLKHGADMLEFDVQVTKDDVPVLHHDPEVKDASGQKKAIGEHTYDELRAYKPNLATLEEVFTQISHKISLYIEVKPGAYVQPIAKIIGEQLERGWRTEQLFLASKDQPTLRALHHILPNHPKIVIHPWSGLVATRRAREVDTKYIAMNHKVLWRGFITPMAKRGWKLLAYTLNDPRKGQRWAGHGLYGVVTDRPDLFEN